MVPIENIQEFRSVGSWNVSFCARLHGSWQSGRSGRTKEPLAGPGAFKRSGHFLWCSIFGIAQKLLVCHKLLKCYGNLQDKFQLTTLLLIKERLIYVFFVRTKDHILYTYFIRRNDHVFVHLENCFKCGVPLDPPRLAQISNLSACAS